MSEKSHTVLVVDDNENNRDLIARRLQRAKYHVILAEDGMEALERLESEAIDLVVLDIMMPVLTGIDVLKIVRKTRSPTELPIIMATAKDQSEDVVEALDAGANDYVTKPLDFPVILARIQMQLRMKDAAAPRPESAKPERDPNDADFVSLGGIRPGMVLGKKYKIGNEIGTGNFGVVYRASHLGFQQDVAVKILQTPVDDSPEILARFQQEGRSAFQLQHANAVSVMDFSVTPAGLAYLVMEMLSGRGLDVEMREHRRVSPARAIELTLPICEVLHEAHGLGIIHRDIKPANIFLHRTRREEIVKVLDFGIAKLVGDAAMGQNLTVDEGILGTPAYMAPERLQGQLYDGRADAYSVGILLYQMLAGRTPFVAAQNEAMAVAMMHVTADPDPLQELRPDISDELSDAVMAMLSKEHDERPTVGELGRRLARIMNLKVPLSLQPTELLSEAESAEPEADPFLFDDLLGQASATAKTEQLKRPPSFFSPSDDVFGLGPLPDDEPTRGG